MDKNWISSIFFTIVSLELFIIFILLFFVIENIMLTFLKIFVVVFLSIMFLLLFIVIASVFKHWFDDIDKKRESKVGCRFIDVRDCGLCGGVSTNGSSLCDRCRSFGDGEYDN